MFIILIFTLCITSHVSFSEEADVAVGFNKNVANTGEPLTASWLFSDKYEPIQRQEVTINGWKDDGSLQRLAFTNEKNARSLTCNSAAGTSVSVVIWFVDADGFSHSYYSDSIPVQGQSGGNAEVVCTFSKAVATFGNQLTVSWEFSGVKEPLKRQEAKIHGWKGNAITTLASSDDTSVRSLSCPNVRGTSVSLVIWYEDGDGFSHNFYSQDIPVEGYVGETEYNVDFSSDYAAVANGPFSVSWIISGVKKPLKKQEVTMNGWKEDNGIIRLAHLDDKAINTISCNKVQGQRVSISIILIDADGFQYSIYSKDFTVINPDYASLKYMKTLWLPSDLKKIEDYAFSGSSCQAVVIPPGCTTIGQYAFSNCPYLMYVRIPSSVKSYPPTVFNECNNNMVVDWEK